MNPGQKNLIPLSDRTKDAQREIQSKGGLASAAARRGRKSLREIMNGILNHPQPVFSITGEYTDLGGGERTMMASMALGLVEKAMKGDVKAFNAIMRIVGEDEPQDEPSPEQEKVTNVTV